MANPCDKNFGIKNVVLGFTPCDGRTVIPPTVHSIYGDEMPKISMVRHKAETMPGKLARVKRTSTPMKMQIDVEVLHWIPLAYYQGDASIHGQIEYFDGRVYTIPEQTGSVPVNVEPSDTNHVMLDLDCELIDERLVEVAPAA